MATEGLLNKYLMREKEKDLGSQLLADTPSASFSPQPPTCPDPSHHTPELGPRLGGLVDVTLVQRALVACLLAQGLVELELQDKAHEVPAGKGWALEGMWGSEQGPLAQAPS